jgi:hypothetical protein
VVFEFAIDTDPIDLQVRERVLRLFKRRKLLSPEDVETMRQWGMKVDFP